MPASNVEYFEKSILGESKPKKDATVQRTGMSRLRKLFNFRDRSDEDDDEPTSAAGGKSAKGDSPKTTDAKAKAPSEPGKPDAKDKPDADAFAAVLRRRGHKAHVEEAHVKGRGLWHRVRIGPFKYKRSAEIYRQDFEAKERMVTFVVDPPKTQIFIAPASGEP